VFYQAMQLGILETVGLGWQRKGEYLQKIQQVTAEQVQQVAQKYLQDDQLTVAMLQPQSIESSATPRVRSATAGGRHGH
jgi:zinc protease